MPTGAAAPTRAHACFLFIAKESFVKNSMATLFAINFAAKTLPDGSEIQEEDNERENALQEAVVPGQRTCNENRRRVVGNGNVCCYFLAYFSRRKSVKLRMFYFHTFIITCAKELIKQR